MDKHRKRIVISRPIPGDSVKKKLFASHGEGIFVGTECLEARERVCECKDTVFIHKKRNAS